MTTLFRERLSSPLGEVLLLTDADHAVHALEWTSDRPRLDRWLARAVGAVEVQDRDESSPAGAAVRSYFEGARAALEDLAVVLHGTDFQTKVWTALRDIPVGETTTYGALARRLGRDKAVRAVGTANGANPVGIICPCHRVIGADGSLTGYAGGLERKRWLLEHEGALGAQLSML